MARAERRAGTARAQEILDAAVLERMEGDHREPATWFEQSLGSGKAALEFAKLVVDRDADRLERAGRRIDAAGLGRHDPADDRRELAGAPDRPLGAGGLDGAGDAPREAFLAIKIDEVGEGG